MVKKSVAPGSFPLDEKRDAHAMWGDEVVKKYIIWNPHTIYE
jgi:hypothetical protein